MQVRCGGLEEGITHPKATAPAMASPKAADFPRPLAAVNATVLLRVFSEMASMNFRTAFAWWLENPQKTVLKFLSHYELPHPEKLSFGQHTNLIQGFAAIHQHSHRLCVLQALLQLPQLQVLGLQAILLRAHNRVLQHISTFGVSSDTFGQAEKGTWKEKLPQEESIPQKHENLHGQTCI